jgi:Kringle domain
MWMLLVWYANYKDRNSVLLFPDASLELWFGLLQEFEYCDVPRCEDDLPPRRFCGSKDIAQQDYRGDVRTTITGKQCVWWVVGDAILERNTPWDLPFAGLVDAYCRNPDGKRAGAWCYVNALPSEKNWEYCDIPHCKDCGSESQNKEDYTGTQSETRSGKTCIPWEDMERFLVEENNTLSMRIDFNGFDLLYQAGIRSEHNLDENYFRNPLPYQRDTVFCFVDESGAWEYCDVPSCEEDTS